MSECEVLATVLPQFFPAHWLEDAPDIVCTEFPSQIRIGYVLRRGGAYSYVMRPLLEQVGVPIGELHSAALHNLGELPIGGLTVGRTPGGSEAFLGGVDDKFLTARILLPTVDEVLTDELGAEYLVALPCRDWFVAWSKSQSAEWQQPNIASALSDFKADDYNLFPDIFLRSREGLSLFFSQTA